jgi:phosphoglycerate dehydrogenase-like enzyme
MSRVRVAIATPLEPELVARIAAVDERVEVLYEPSLLPRTRYVGDHRGHAISRYGEARARWDELLASAEVLFGLPGDSADGLRDIVRRSGRLRWVQGTAAGAGEQVAAAALTPRERERVAVTTSAGVHAVPLAEFALLGLLAFAKDLPRLVRDKAERRWDHYPVAELRGRTVLVLGLGGIGREVVRLASAFGMRTLGIRRRAADVPQLDELHPPERLRELLPRADAVVVTLPSTEATRGLLGRAELAVLPRGATLVNVGRGAVVDEEALVDALRDGRLAGAALDVFAHEPLPPESPLWELPNVLLAPHTMALSIHENARIVDLFCANLRRYLDGEALTNLVDPEHDY